MGKKLLIISGGVMFLSLLALAGFLLLRSRSMVPLMPGDEGYKWTPPLATATVDSPATPPVTVIMEDAPFTKDQQVALEKIDAETVDAVDKVQRDEWLSPDERQSKTQQIQEERDERIKEILSR